jgi:hypothetical protein
VLIFRRMNIFSQLIRSFPQILLKGIRVILLIYCDRHLVSNLVLNLVISKSNHIKLSAYIINCTHKELLIRR